jgi:hypothetical protein
MLQVFSYSGRFLWRSIVMQQPDTTEIICLMTVFEIFFIYKRHYLCKTWHLQIYPLVRQFE